LVSKPENVLNQIVIDNQTVFVLMTHNYNYDMLMLESLLSKNVVYVGMLGPRKKKERILEELQEKGTRFTSQELSILYSPVGLDIGAETPEEIALSIVSEIKAVLSGRQAMSLKNNADVIHSRSAARIDELRLTSGL
jgi:xanthine dehydrogenase accessory factor